MGNVGPQGAGKHMTNCGCFWIVVSVENYQT
jgi:hypothetical protein